MGVPFVKIGLGQFQNDTFRNFCADVLRAYCGAVSSIASEVAFFIRNDPEKMEYQFTMEVTVHVGEKVKLLKNWRDVKHIKETEWSKEEAFATGVSFATNVNGALAEPEKEDAGLQDSGS